MEMFDMVFAWGRAVTTNLKGAAKAVLANVSAGDESEGSNGEPIYSALGVFFRPKPPVAKADATGRSPEGFCEVLCARTADGLVPIGFRDLRLTAKVNPKEGEIGLAQYLGGFVSLKDNKDGDGTDVVVYAPRVNSSGTPIAAHAISLDSSEANSSIALVHSFGQSITMTKEGHTVIANKTGSASIVLKDDGDILLNGKVRLPSGMAVGAAGSQPVMLATTLLAWIGQVNTAITALTTHVHTGVTSGVASSGPPATPPVVPAAVPVPSTTLNASP